MKTRRRKRQPETEEPAVMPATTISGIVSGVPPVSHSTKSSYRQSSCQPFGCKQRPIGRSWTT